MNDIEFNETLDLQGLSCPMPIIKIKKKLKSMATGEVLCAIGTDPGTKNDVGKVCQKDGNTLLQLNEDNGIYTFYIQKGSK